MEEKKRPSHIPKDAIPIAFEELPEDLRKNPPPGWEGPWPSLENRMGYLPTALQEFSEKHGYTRPNEG